MMVVNACFHTVFQSLQVLMIAYGIASYWKDTHEDVEGE
jgi:hypothetical protein